MASSRETRIQKERELSNALQLVLTCDTHHLLSVASQETLQCLKNRLAWLAQALELKLSEGPQPVLDEKAIKEDILPAALWTYIFFSFLDPYGQVAAARTCMEFRQLISRNEMALLNNFMSRPFAPGTKSPTSSPPNSPALSPARQPNGSPPQLQRVLSPQMFTLLNPPDLEGLKALAACVRLRPTVLRVSMLPYQYIESVINFTTMAFRHLSRHHEGDDEDGVTVQTEVLLASLDLLLALLWRPRFSETHVELHAKIFSHILSNMSVLHDQFEVGWLLVLSSFSSHDRYDRGFVTGLLRPYLNPFRHYSTFSLLAVSDLRCLLQLLPKMFSPTLADKLFEHLVRLHGLLGGTLLAQGVETKVEEVVPLMQAVIGLFPFIPGGQRLKPQIDQIASSLAFYQKRSGGDPKGSKSKQALERKRSSLLSQLTRNFPSSASKPPRPGSTAPPPPGGTTLAPKLDRVPSGGLVVENGGRDMRPAMLRMGSGGSRIPTIGRLGSGDSDRLSVMSGSESDNEGSLRRNRQPGATTSTSKDFTDKLFTSSPQMAAKQPAEKVSGITGLDTGFGLSGDVSEVPMFLRTRSRSFGPAESRQLIRDHKERQDLDADDEDEDEDEEDRQELKRKLFQEQLHRQLQQQLQSQQFEQLQRQQMVFLQQLQTQQMQALAVMQRQQSQFLQVQLDHKTSAEPGLTGFPGASANFAPGSPPPPPVGNTHTFIHPDHYSSMISNASSPPSRPLSPLPTPPPLSCSSASSACPFASSSFPTGFPSSSTSFPASFPAGFPTSCSSSCPCFAASSSHSSAPSFPAPFPPFAAPVASPYPGSSCPASSCASSCAPSCPFSPSSSFPASSPSVPSSASPFPSPFPSPPFSPPLTSASPFCCSSSGTFSPPSRPQSPTGSPPFLCCSSSSTFPPPFHPFSTPPSSASSNSFCSVSSPSNFSPATSASASSACGGASASFSAFSSSSTSSSSSSSSSNGSSAFSFLTRRPPPPPTTVYPPPLTRDGSGSAKSPTTSAFPPPLNRDGSGKAYLICPVCSKASTAHSTVCVACAAPLHPNPTVHWPRPSAPPDSNQGDMIQTPVQRMLLMQGQGRGSEARRDGTKGKPPEGPADSNGN